MAALVFERPSAMSFCACASLVTVTLYFPGMASLSALAVSTEASPVSARFLTVLAEASACAADCSDDKLPLIEPRLVSFA